MVRLHWLDHGLCIVYRGFSLMNSRGKNHDEYFENGEKKTRRKQQQQHVSHGFTSWFARG